MISASILGIMGLGGQEMVFIFLALLLLFGAKKIPELARGLGKVSASSRMLPKMFARISRIASKRRIHTRSKSGNHIETDKQAAPKMGQPACPFLFYTVLCGMQ